MKRKMKFYAAGDDFPPSPDEYRMFRGQPEKVLAGYSLARRCMASVMPFSALAAVYSPALALALPLTGGITGFLLLRKKYGVKGALVPLFCFLAGIPIGLYILSPLLSHALALKEAYRGI
jgi:hypothetical protein